MYNGHTGESSPENAGKSFCDATNRLILSTEIPETSRNFLISGFMKKPLIISVLIVTALGVSFFVFQNKPAINDSNKISEMGSSESTNGNKTMSINQNIEKPIDALWISTNFFQKTDKLYIDLQRDGKFFSKREVQGKTEVRFGSLTQDVINQAFKAVDTRGVLNAKDSGEGEPLFSQSEWVKVGMSIDGKTKFSQSAPIEDFPSDFQQLLKDLKLLAEKQVVAQDIKAFIFAELVDSQRAKSIREDPRKFFVFVEIKESDLIAIPSAKNAIGTVGRQIPLRDNAELQKIEEYIKLSNLKSISKEFFITFDGKSYQLQLLNQ